MVDHFVEGSRANGKAATTAPDLVGRSTPMLEVKALLERIADTDASVCIWGERGTGRKHLARVLHARSPRRGGPFIMIDCAAAGAVRPDDHVLPGPAPVINGGNDTPERMLLGAHSGTLVLEELPALDLAVQARLAQALRRREIPGGDGTERRVDVRTLATTSRDPRGAVDDGGLHEALYYRVAVVLIRMPALRERPEDIPLLVEHFLRCFSTTYRKPVLSIAPGVLERLRHLPWPGNVSQLENILRQAFLLAEGDTITEEHLSASSASR